MMIIIFKIQVVLERSTLHRYNTGNMKFINKRKERKGCITFNTRIASKNKTLRLKQSKESVDKTREHQSGSYFSSLEGCVC